MSSAAALVLSSPVFASGTEVSGTEVSAGNPTQASSAEGDFGEILVQARRRSENLRTVPIAITALPAEVITEKQIVTTQDLTFVTPGLIVAPALSRDQPAFVIRGMQRLTTGDGVPAVLTYFADVPLPNDGGILPAYDIGSIQVLKGPQGTLFGRNTTGGAILVYPQAAGYELGGYVRGTYGKYDERTLEGGLNIPIVSDRVALRVAGQIARRDGYTKNLSGGPDLDDRHTESFRATLQIEPFDGFKNVTIFDYYRAREAGTGIVLAEVYPLGGLSNGGLARMFPFSLGYDCGVSPACDIDLALAQQRAAGPRAVYSNITPYSNRDIWGITNTTTLDVTDGVTLKNIFGYRNVKIDYARNYDGTALPWVEHIGKTTPEQYTNELQAFGDLFDNKLDWIVGAFYYRSGTSGTSGAQVTTLAPFIPVTVIEKYNNETSKALFAQLGYSIVPRLKLNAGFRYTWDKVSQCGFSALAAAGFVGDREGCIDNGGNLATAKSSAPTWTLGLEYKATDDLFLYATTRRGYRAGGVNRSGMNPILAPAETYAPEKVTDVELGAKAALNLGSTKVTANIAAYRTKYKNIQTTLLPRPNYDGDNNPANDPFSLIVSPGTARIQGIEFDGTISPATGVTLSGFLNYTDAKYLDFQLPPSLQPLSSFTAGNSAFPYTPRWSGGLGLDLFHDLANGMGRLSANINYFRSGPVRFSVNKADPLSTEGAYSNTSARVYWDKIGGSGIGAGIFARNLFNTTYAAAAGFAVAPLSVSSRIYNEPRIYGVELRFGFGAP